MNERKHTKQMKKLKRGHRFKNATTDAASPTHMTVINICELEDSHKIDGAYQ